jgi:hypothetical protein
MLRALEAAGFAGARVTHRFDSFGGTSKERTARKYGVIGVTVIAQRVA